MSNVFHVFDIVRVDAFVGLFCGSDCLGWVDLLYMIRLARWPPICGMGVHMNAADDAFGVD